MLPPPLSAPINVNIYQRTLTSDYGAFVEDIAPRLSSYEHSIADTCGFESLTCRMLVTKDEAEQWCERLLFGCKVYGRGGGPKPCWEGKLHTVEYQVGGETISYSLETLANRVRVLYTLSGLGTVQPPAIASDANSIAIYGTRDFAVSIDLSTAAAAANQAASLLSERALPMPKQDSQIALASSAGDAQGQLVALTLLFTGWYDTLGWVLTERGDTSVEETTDQVADLLSTSSPGIGATNPFLSTSSARITASGVSDTREIAPDTPYRTKIEALLAQGNSSGQALRWGVYEDRQFVVDVWAGATPDVITYRTRLGSSLVETAAGLIVPPWAVRPNAMVETADLITVGPPAGSIATPGRRPIARVVCTIDSGGVGLRLEPSQTTNADAMLARLGGR